VGFADSGSPAQTASEAYTLAVATPLIPTASPLSGGVVSVAYSVTLDSGGTAPYSCSITAGAVPAGLTLNAATCVISGTPSSAGVYGFTVRNADSASPAQVKSQAYNLTVATLLTLAASPLNTGAVGLKLFGRSGARGDFALLMRGYRGHASFWPNIERRNMRFKWFARSRGREFAHSEGDRQQRTRAGGDADLLPDN
jgi:hypothetical protein